MPLTDLQALLAPISDAEPAGPNLEYDAAFAAFELMAQGKPEQQMGDKITPAEEPDWKVVHKQAVELLGRSKDLRVGVHLTRALLRLGGLPGFGEGLAVVRGLVDTFWDTVHPQLDPDDGNDPTMRVNVLSGLVDGPTIAAVRAAPLVSSRVLGRFGLREVAVASGESPATPGQPAMR